MPYNITVPQWEIALMQLLIRDYYRINYIFKFYLEVFIMIKLHLYINSTFMIYNFFYYIFFFTIIRGIVRT